MIVKLKNKEQSIMPLLGLGVKENFDIFDFQISPEDVILVDNFNENYRVVENPMDLF